MVSDLVLLDVAAGATNTLRPLTHSLDCSKEGLAVDATRRKMCIIEGCGKPRAGRGWCSMHWHRWRHHGDPLYVRPKPPPPECTLPGCNKRRHSHGMCSQHLYHQQAYGDPYHQGPGTGVGRKRTDNPGYDAVHRRLTREIGPARSFDCAECGDPAQEWAYMGGCPNEQVQDVAGHHLRFSADQSRYIPLCRKCHRPLDDSGTRIFDEKGWYMANAPEYVRPEPTMKPHPRRSKRTAEPGEPAGVHITITGGAQ